METIDHSEGSYFDSFFTLYDDEYPTSESCLHRLVVEVSNGTEIKSGICFSEVFDNELKVKQSFIDDDFNEFGLSKFATLCGVTKCSVVSIMMAYLANKHYNEYENIMKNFLLDINILSWMFYHEVNPQLFIKSINFKHKSNNSSDCVICNATQNVTIVNNHITTISPEYMSSDRKGQKYGITHCHYVIWSRWHDGSVSNEESGYTHVIDQYGHPHLHIIKGEYFDIRANEIRIFCQKMINNNCMPLKSDFYNPIHKFFMNCSYSGRENLTVAIMICIRKIKMHELFNKLFYKSSYPKLFKQVYFKMLIDNEAEFDH